MGMIFSIYFEASRYITIRCYHQGAKRCKAKAICNRLQTGTGIENLDIILSSCFDPFCDLFDKKIEI
ncbi:hypothetical protein JCM12296A_49870 [Desulfosarcina cetonica]